jgi:diguanylate cyclase
MEQPFELGPGLWANVGASVGLATVTDDESNIDTLLRLADAAMYDAKRNRKREVADYRR